MMKKISFAKLKDRITKRSKNKCKLKEVKHIEDTKDLKEDGSHECLGLQESVCTKSQHFDVNYDRLSTHSENNQTKDPNNGLEINKFVKLPTILMQSFRNKFRKTKSKPKTNRISQLNETKPEFGYHSNDIKTDFNCKSNEISLTDEYTEPSKSLENVVNDDCLSEDHSSSSSANQTPTDDIVNKGIVSAENNSEKKFSIAEEIERILGTCNVWYWGPITRIEAEDRLRDQIDGSFLVRDSSDNNYLFSLSFRSFGRTLHTRIEYTNGLFSFYSNGSTDGSSSLIDLIHHSMTDSEKGVFCYSRGRSPVSQSFPVRLTRPLSRFSEVRSLQYLCKFVIRQSTSFSQIQSLPLPKSIKGFIENTIY